MSRVIKNIMLFFLGTVFDMTVSAGFLEDAIPYLPYMWMCIFTYFTWSLLQHRWCKKHALSLYKRFGVTYPVISYITIGLFGAGLLSLYWYGIQRVFQKRAETAQVEQPTVSPHETTASKPEPRPLTAAEVEEAVKRQLAANPSPKPAKPIFIKVHFKNSTLFTEDRKRKLIREVNDFYEYLVGLGYEVPKEMPPLGIGQGVLTTEEGIFDDHIRIRAKFIDTRGEATGMYSWWIFTKLYPNDFRNPAARFNMDLWEIYPQYYVSSFLGRYEYKQKGVNDWANALWDMREKFGQDFADRLLYYSHARRKGAGPSEENFETFFWNKFHAGLYTIVDRGKDTEEVSRILAKHGITAPQRKE